MFCFNLLVLSGGRGQEPATLSSPEQRVEKTLSTPEHVPEAESVIDVDADVYQVDDSGKDSSNQSTQAAPISAQIKPEKNDLEAEDDLITVNPLIDDQEEPLLDELDDDDSDDISDEELGEDVELLDADDPDDDDATERLFADDETDLLSDEPDLDTSAFDDVNPDHENEAFDDESFFDEDIAEETEKRDGPYNPQTGAKITHPLLGELIFAPSPEAVKNQSSQPIGKMTNRTLELSTKSQGNKLSHGMIATTTGAVITKPKLHVTSKGNLSLTGTFIANNIRGKVRLKSFTDGDMLFDVDFPRSLRIQITPDRAVNIQHFTLSLSSTGDVEFFARKFVFKKKPVDYDPEDEEEDTTITFGVTAQESDARATTEELPLHVLMKQAKESKDLEKIMLEELVFEIANPFSSKPPPTQITVECTARLNHIKLWGNTRLSNSTCEITLDQNSVELSSQGDTPIIFDDSMTLEHPLVEIEVSKGERPEFTLGGTMACNFPVIGKMKLPVQGEKRDDGITIKGKIEKKIGFGPIAFGNPELIVSTSDGSVTEESDQASSSTDSESKEQAKRKQKKVEVTGTGTFFGFKIKPVIRMVKQTNGSKRKVSFSAKFDAPNLSPFSFIPGLKSIPGLKDLKIPDAFLGMSSAKKMFIGGSVKALGIVGKIKLIPKNKIMEIASDKPWRLSDTIPGAKGTIFDSVLLNNIRFAAAAKAGYDDATDSPIRKGLNAFGTLDTSQGMFANLRKMMGGALPQSVTAAIVLSANPRHCKYVIMLPFDIKLSSKQYCMASHLRSAESPQ